MKGSLVGPACCFFEEIKLGKEGDQGTQSAKGVDPPINDASRDLDVSTTALSVWTHRDDDKAWDGSPRV